MGTILNDILNKQQPVLDKQENKSILSEALKVSNNGHATDVQLGQFGVGESQYDIGITPENVVNLEHIRGERQTWGAEAVNAIGGGIAKIPFSVIGNVASILDFEDYYNTDNEIGNSITAWAEEIKGNIEEATKIYKSNDNTLGSREWWMNNAKGLIDSAGGFIATGAGLGKGVQLLSNLAKGSKVIQGIGTVANAAMLNQAESVPIAMKVYNDSYNIALKQGKNEEEANVIAADAAAYSININRINIPLNLTSAYAFLRPVDVTRQVAKDFSRKEVLANILKEGAQEYLEEDINMIAEKEAIRKATDGNKYSYDFNNTVNDVLSKEGFETGLVGFIGGVVQTGATDLISSLQKDAPSYDIDGNIKTDENGKPILVNRIQSQKERFKAQQKSLNNIELLAKSEGLNTVKETLDKVKITSEILNDIQIASIANDELKVNELKNKLLTTQALDAFKNGTTEQLINTYKSIQRDPSSKEKLGDDYQIKSTEAIKEIETLEKVYQNYQYLPQVNDVFNNRADYSYNLKEANRLKIALLESKARQLEEIEITGYTTPELINSLETTKETLKIQDKFNKVRDNVIKLNEDFSKITSKEYTEEVTKDKEEQTVTEEPTDSNKPLTVKSFVDKLEAGETLNSDEAEQFYVNNKEEIDKEALLRQQSNNKDSYIEAKKADIERRRQEMIQMTDFEKSESGLLDKINALYDAELAALEESTKTTDESINESEVDETNIPSNVSSIEITKGGKIAQTPFKTESGLDDDSDENRNRYFRYIEKNKLADKRLLIVTKNNNSKLYNEILNLRPEAKEFESKNKNYQGIYVVVADKNNNPILVDGKPIFSTLTTVQRLKEGGVKATKEDEAKLTALREEILANKNPNIYLPITGKSKGIINFLPKIENKRQSNSVVGRVVNSIKDAQLELLTAVAFGQTNLGELPNGLLAKVGKLYIKDETTSNYIDLVPRKLNDDELLMSFDLINQMMKVTPKKVATPKAELEKIIFVGLSKRGANEYTIAVRDGKLLIGTETLSKEEFSTEEGRDKLAKALQNKYVNISKEFDLNDKFLAPKTDDKQNSKEYTSYKEYLLEGETPMFGTDIPTRAEVQYRNQYLIYSPTIKEDTIKSTATIQLNKDEDDIVSTLDLDDLLEDTPKEKEKKDESPKKLTTIKRTLKPGRSLDRIATPKTLSAPKLTNEELNWFKTNFPNIPIEKIQGLIENKSLGRFISEGKVLLSEEATMGTLYHEAFHTVTQLYLSKEEIDRLYNETSKQFPNKSRLELEEILAEDFINYKETKEVLKNAPVRNSVFRKLLNFLRDLLNLKANNIEDVYRRLDKGFYKSKPIIGVREFTALDRIAGFSVSDTKKILDEIDASFYEILLDDNDKTIGDLYSKPELVNKILGIIKDELSSNELIKENWNSIIKAWADRFKSISGEIDLGEDFINDIENDSVIKDEVADSRQGDALQEFNVISTKSLINKETRLLIRGLKQKEIVDGELVDKLTDIGTKIPVEFNKTYNLILKNLQGISEWQDQYNKLIELSEIHPELIALVERLGPPSGDISMDKFLQWMKFRQDFDKNKLNSFITIIEANGNVYIVNAVSQVVYDRVKEEWRNNIKTKATLNDAGKLVVPTEITNIKNNIDFLAELGITFSPEAIENTKNNSDFNQSVNQLRIYISNKKGDVTNLFSDDTISTRMNLLYALEGDVSKTVNELSFLSTEGKTVYSITQNNALSIVKNIINSADNIQDVYTKLPHLNTVSTKNSVWMSKLFNEDGSRNKDITLDLDLHDGMKNSNKSIEETELELETGEEIEETIKTKKPKVKVKAKKEASTRKLSIGEKYVQEINSLLTTGKSSYIRASDKASEFVLSLNKSNSKSKLIIPMDKLAKSVDIQEVRDVFKNYFKAELERIALFELKGLGKNIDQYNNNGSKFTIFEGFDINKKEIKERILALDVSISEEELSVELNKIYNEFESNINTGIVKYLTNYSNEIRNKFSEYNITHGQGIAEQFKTNSLDQIARTVAVNDLINTIEQIKLFVGDMAFYKDLFKRTAAFTGTKETSAVGEEINNFLNSNNKRVDGKIANDKINVTVFEDSVQQAGFIEEYIQALIDNGYSPKEAKNILSSYYNMEEGDAQGWITLDEYREFGIRRGDWSEYQEQAFEKLQKGETLSSKELIVFLTLKAQYAGPQEYNGLYAPAYHKFSLLPLIPQLVKETNLETLLETMSNKDNQIGYALFKTGSKVGTKLNKDGKVTPFYKDDSLNTEDWVKQVVDYRFFGLQVKSSDPKAKVIFGTQFRKLLFLDLFENGNSKFKGDYDDYNNIISELVEDEKNKLIKELGINTSNYSIENVTSLVKLLQDEAKKRNLADNIIEAIQSEIIEGKTILKYNLDTMVNKDKIDSMIMSLIDSRLIRQKMNGDSLVQASIAGFEKAGIRKSNTLKFYRQDADGNTLDAECKISMSKDFYSLLKEYKTLDKLNQAIKNNKLNSEHKALLKLVGYRIPTQGLNSMESLEIVEFLPETTNTIILPTELVAKSGGDFDIDKLNIFRKNPLKDFDYIYKNIQNIINEDVTRFNEAINDGTPESNLIKSIFTDNILDEKQELETLRELKVSKEQFDKFKKLADKSEFELYYKKQLAQNKIIDIAKKILTDKDNFVNLITPNTTKDLKGLANQFDYEEYLNKKRDEALKNNKEFKPVSFEEYLANQKAQAKNIRYTDQLKLTTKIDQFYKFMLAKDMIGIAAIANTHHSLSQQVNASLNTSYSVKNPFTGEIEYKNAIINFPHNKLEDGKISLSSIKDAKGINKISDIISQIINATVDAAKDPFMFTINMTKDTLSTYLYLIRIGVPFNMVGNFMKQPVITEYLKQLSINNSSYNNSKKSNKSIQTELILKYLADLNFNYTRRPNSGGGGVTIDTKHFIGIKSIKDLKAKYKELAVKNHPDKGGKTEVMQEINNEYDVLKRYPFLLNSNITEEEITEAALIGDDDTISPDNIFFENEEQLSQFLNKENQTSQLFYKTQLQVLEDFLKYKEQSTLLGDAMRASNIDTAGVGKNLGSVYNKKELINKVKQDGFFNGLDRIFQETFIGAMNVNDFVIGAYSPLYYTQNIPEIVSNTNGLINKIKGTLFPFGDREYNKLRTLIENDFINYVIQNYGYKDIKTLQNRIFKTESVAKRLIEAKKDETLKNNLLIQELFPLIAQVNKNVDNVKIFAKRYDTYTADLLTESFRELGELDDVNAKQLYKDLMDLGIIQSGLNNSPITYLGLIPYEYYNDLAKRAFDEFNKKNGVGELDKFNELFVRENSNDALVNKYALKLKLNGKTKGYGMYGKVFNKNTANNLESTEKSSILNKREIIQPKGKPPIDLTEENNC